MVSFPWLYIKGFFVEIMRSLFSSLHYRKQLWRRAQSSLLHSAAPHCDERTDGHRKDPPNHTPITKQKWQRHPKHSTPHQGRQKTASSGQASAVLHLYPLVPLEILRSRHCPRDWECSCTFNEVSNRYIFSWLVCICSLPLPCMIDTHWMRVTGA